MKKYDPACLILKPIGADRPLFSILCIGPAEVH